MNYIYNATVVSVYDGDTITVDVDLGLYMTMRNLKIRIYGINAPEIRGVTKPQGEASRDALLTQIQVGEQITLQTIKDEKEKYGRWLGIIISNGVNVNKWMIDNNYAISYLDPNNIIS